MKVNPAQLIAAKKWLTANQSFAGNCLKIAVILGTLNALLLIVQAWLLAQTMHRVMFEGGTINDVSTFLWWALSLIILRALLNRLTQRYAFRAGQAVKHSVRNQLHKKLFELGPVWLSGQQSGAVSNLLHEGVESLTDYYTLYLPALAFSALIPLAILAIILPIDWQSGLIFLLSAPLVPFFMILIGLKTENINQKRWRDLSRMGGHFLDVIQGLTQLKLFSASKREATAIATISDNYRRNTMSVLKIAFLSSLTLEFLATVSIALVAITIGFRLYWGDLHFSTGFMVLLLAPEFYTPLRNLGTQYHARMQAIIVAEKIITILQTTSTPSDIKPASTFLTAAPTISVNTIYYTYDNNRPALEGLSARFDRSGLYALVGKSGAGKTTLIDCLLGFINPQVGDIYINARRLSADTVKAWQHHLAWIPQSPRLLSASVADNIAMYKAPCDMAHIKQAAERAGIADVIASLPDNYDTLIGEGGHNLSGGEVQRIALARAFYHDANVLILDEPSAHLDKQSEAIIRHAIYNYAIDKLVIVSAHRLSTVKQAKQIMVIDNGKLIEQGTHATLSAKKGIYHQFLKKAIPA